MTDAPQGPGWWQASDGRFYPPEQHPNANPTQPVPPVPSAPTGPAAPQQAWVAPPQSQPSVWGQASAQQGGGNRSNNTAIWVIAGFVALVVLIIGVAIGAAASGDDKPDTQAAAASTGATTSALPETTAGPKTTAATSTTAAPTTAAPTTTVSAPPTAPPTLASSLMPNVVCMNLQDAQDTIQTAGVFFSRSFDATGAGRSQIIDSNWVVVSQDPAPGAPIAEVEPNLGAVKYGEPSPC